MRFTLLAIALVGCAAPSASSLTPTVSAYDELSHLYIDAHFASGDPDVEIEATFRGKTVPALHDGAGSYVAVLELDTPLATDESLSVTLDGVEISMTAPAAFDTVDVPLFISRTQDAMISWSPATAEPLRWDLVSSSCARSPGGDIPANATSLTFHATDWTTVTNEQRDTCTTDVLLQRERTTPTPAAFAGGTLMFYRQADLRFASSP